MRIRSSRGFTLVGILAALTAGAILVGALVYMLGWTASTYTEAMTRVQIDAFGRDIIHLVQSDAGWLATLNGPANTGSMNCLLEHKPCTPGVAYGSGRSLALYNPDGSLFYDATKPVSGINKKGMPCAEFSTQGNDACPYRFDVTWAPVCSPPVCIDPVIRINVAFAHSPKASGIPINPKMYSFALYRTSSGAASNAPTNLKLTHTPNHRLFSVSWTAGSGNDGAGGCKLQYQRDGSVWTDLNGAYDCDSDTTDAPAQFPVSSGWTNNFSFPGVSVRLVRVRDDQVQGLFPQRATCSGMASSSFPTPDIDEDCNGEWDNRKTLGCEWYPTSSKAPGAPYSCPNVALVKACSVSFCPVSDCCFGSCGPQYVVTAQFGYARWRVSYYTAKSDVMDSAQGIGICDSTSQRAHPGVNLGVTESQTAAGVVPATVQKFQANAPPPVPLDVRDGSCKQGSWISSGYLIDQIWKKDPPGEWDEFSCFYNNQFYN